MTPRSPDDELARLLARTAEGDSAAFAELYQHSSAKLFGIICRILPNRDVAREALQEAYVAIWRRASSFDPEIASPISWMATIARHKAIDVRRLSAERVSGDAVPVEEDIVSLRADADSFDNTARNEALRRLLACLEELPEERRQMVLLAYYQGWSRKELGQRFERPVTTVKSLLRRSLMLLKECLDGAD